MTRKKSELIPAGQTNLFDLFGVDAASPAAEAVQAEEPSLPEGWAEEDIRFLLNVLEEGPILVADTELGIPTIHGDFGAEVVQRGFGLMSVQGLGYKLDFDAGGAMQRTPSGKGWTRLYIEGKYPYDVVEVRKMLTTFLPKEGAGRAADLCQALDDVEPLRGDRAGKQAGVAAWTELRKRDLELPQYIVVMDKVDELPFTTDDDSLIKVYCVGREVALVTGELVTIAGFFKHAGSGKYIETLQPGGNLAPPGVELELEPGRDRCIHRSFLRGVLLDQRQLDELSIEIPQLRGMAEPWPGSDVPAPEVVPLKVSLQEQAARFRSTLQYFTGSEQWTRHPTLCPHIVLLTDGALYVAQNGGEDGNSAYWLIDALASYQGEGALKRHSFQVWTLTVHPPDELGPEQNSVMAALQVQPGRAPEKPFNPHRHATLMCTNGNGKELARQEIEMTDILPVGSIRLYASVEEHPDVSAEKKTMIVLLDSEY